MKAQFAFHFFEWQDVPDVERDQIDRKEVYRALRILFLVPAMQMQSVGASVPSRARWSI